MDKLCQCGCGQPAPLAKRNRFTRGEYKGQPLQFIFGHSKGRVRGARISDEECARRKRYKREGMMRLHNHVDAYLALHPCIDCGESDIAVLDFDHRNPEEKYKSISQIIAGKGAIATLEQEMTKCDVRCANCHRRKHRKEWAKKLSPVIDSV